MSRTPLALFDARLAVPALDRDGRQELGIANRLGDVAIAASGSITRRIGRCRSDLSPVNVALIGKPAAAPISKRRRVSMAPGARSSPPG